MDPKVATAWKRAGFETGWIGIEFGTEIIKEFLTERTKLDTALPCFAGWPLTSMNNLPEPSTDFAIRFDVLINRNPKLLNSRVQVTENMIKELARFKKLKHLEVGVKGNAAFLTAISQLQSLETLYLSLSSDDKTSLKPIGGLHQLRHLGLASSAVNNTGMPAVLAGKSGGINDRDLKDLGALQNLEVLNLRNSQVTDQGLKSLASFAKLKVLDLSFSPITDEGLKDLTALKQLKVLYLDNNVKITDKGVLALAPLTKLERVFVRDTFVTGESIRAMEKLNPKLRIIIR